LNKWRNLWYNLTGMNESFPAFNLKHTWPEQLIGRLTSLRHWAEPTWATLCGVLASGHLTSGWEERDRLHLALLLILVNLGWATLWSTLSSTNWKQPLTLWQTWDSRIPLPALPYTRADSPADLISRRLGELLQWWREAVWPELAPAIVALLAALVLSLVLSIYLGTDALLLTIAALALMELGIRGNDERGTPHPQWDSLIAITLPWIAGHTIFTGPPPPHSIGIALAFAIARASTWRPASRPGLLTLIAVQTLTAIMLIALQHPLAAGCLLLLVMPQLLLWPRAAHKYESSYTRYAWPWLTAAMGIAAWAIRGQ
jgi:hypothetical protein